MRLWFELVAGAGNATALGAGTGFTLTSHPRQDQNKSYLVTAANFRLHGQSPTSGGVAENPFSCTFVAIDATFVCSYVNGIIAMLATPSRHSATVRLMPSIAIDPFSTT